MLNLSELIIDPRSVGKKLFLVAVKPVYEYREGHRISDEPIGFKYEIALPEKHMENTIVYFSNSEVCEKLNCGHDTATKCFRELEANGLIQRKKQGKGKPDIIYVENLRVCEKTAHQTEDNPNPEMLKNRSLKCGKTARNYKYKNNNEYTNINLPTYEEMEEEIKDQIEYDVLSERGYGEVLNEIVNLLTDTYCSTEPIVNIGKRQIAADIARYRFSKLTAEHIEEVINKLSKNTTKILNMRAYLLTLIYNSIDFIETDGLYGN